ncbi:glycosyltransferase [Paenibacillus sp. H1-7]|uniref:TPR domain-containing glycosyltransferase n=1 Tax=Paenibacillus sp. H1-7 TaxID=2282849 RepID=UPI001EF756D8|nr:TPR domain-containing glycosyltransferase [Paenibacillus sp. H1-7]ULL13150.1 glycosyltransferase [Paenibacillus sp. H1-7]
MKQLLLGVHVIARNEEAVLARCLESVRSIADELIVVDTGSTDRTADIALSYGAKVVHEPWRDDFAQARNTGIAHAASEWILVIDADEEVVDGAERIVAFLKETEADKALVRIVNPVGELAEEKVTYESERLFRSGKGYRFEGAIHEQLVRDREDDRESDTGQQGEPLSTPSDGAAALSPPLSPLLLHHTGYLPAELSRKKTIERNMRILQRVLEEHPEDPFHIYNLGVTYCQSGQAEQALAIFARALRLATPGAPYRGTLVRDYAKVLLAAGDYAEASVLLQEETKRYSGYSDLHLLHGESLEGQGLLSDAFNAYRDAIHATGGGTYITEAGANSYRPLTGLARVAGQQGRTELAGRLYREALSEHPHYEPALAGWADLLQLSGLSDDSIKARLIEAVQPDNTAAYELVARVLAACGAYAAALAVLQPLSDAARALVCECLMQTGQFAEAAGRFAAWRQSGGLPESAAADWALCCWSEQRPWADSAEGALPPLQLAAFAAIERWLLDGTGQPEAPSADPPLHKLACERMERAVELRLLRLARRLSELAPQLSLELAKSLYRYGYVLSAADRLLGLMERSELDAEGLFHLGEVLYVKGFYGQAAALFEQSLALVPDQPRARTGAALSYLQLAYEVAAESYDSAPDAQVLHNDMRKLEQVIATLSGFGWRTQRTGRQRRNAHAAEADISMHDS